MNTKLRVAGLLMAATVVAAAEIRTWTFEKSGKTVEAEVAGFTGSAVTLREADGKKLSVPIAYLSRRDRDYLAAEQTKQWKDVEVLKLDASASDGPYRKCSVRGAGVEPNIYVQRLPASVEVVLQDRNKQAAPMADLSSQIDAEKNALHDAKSGLSGKRPKNRVQRREAKAERGKLNVETSNLHAQEANLAKLKKAYDESVEKTRGKTMVKMRNTGVIYKGLSVWQCFDPTAPQP